MANVNSTLSRTQSKPEKLALWLFKVVSNWRLMLAFLLILALTAISVTFNIMLGRMSGIEGTLSEYILPAGYALLDVSALFLSSYIGAHAISLFKRILAWLWFGLLLALSLWAAATFTLAIDSQRHNTALEESIDQKESQLVSVSTDVAIWQEKVAYSSKHKQSLDDAKDERTLVSDELEALKQNLPHPTMAIYNMVAPHLNMTPDTLQTIVKLLWAGALTITALVIMILISGGLMTSQTDKTDNQPTPPRGSKRRTWDKIKDAITTAFESRKGHATVHAQAEEKTATHMATPSVQQTHALLPVEHIEPKQGHNQHTETLSLNGLKRAQAWLARQPIGRVTKAKLGTASRIYSREGVNRIIAALVESGELTRLSNGHFSKSSHNKGLRLIKGGLKEIQ